MKLRRVLQIHAWGGLGSQLFALAFAIELLQKNHSRSIALILHSSGVTRRESELDFARETGIEIEIVDDFISSRNAISVDEIRKKYPIKSIFRRIFRFLSSILGFKLFWDPPDLFMRSWTSEIRCHYYKRRISMPALTEVRSLIVQYGLVSEIPIENCVVHYRLGDLINLESKSPIPTYRIKNGIRMATANSSKINWIVASDSPDMVEDLLRGEEMSTEMTVYNGSAWQTLDILSRSRTLVASSSKLSLWGILIGISLGLERNVYLPAEMLEDVRKITEYTSNTKLIPY